MSVAANHCQEQCVHPTSAQQSRAGPQFRQISHSCLVQPSQLVTLSLAIRSHINLALHKPHQPGARLCRSAVCSPCSVLGMTPVGAGQHLWATSPTLHSSCSSEVGATSECAPVGVAAGRSQLLPFRPQIFGATLSSRQGKHT